MARRRSEDAEVQNGKKKQEEIDTFQTVYIDTNLDTRLALVASHFDSVLDLKKKVMLEHLNCFPKLGEITIHALKVKRKGHFYHLSDSMRINRAFEGVKNSWFLSVDASCMKQLSENEQSCRPNTSNRSPMLCLPYNLTNTGCNNDDASTSSILKSASVQCPSNQKVEPIQEDSCREFSEDIAKKHKCSSSEILKNVSADHNRVSDLSTAGKVAANIQCSDYAEPSPEIGLPVKKKKQKIRKHNVDELGDSPVKENISLEHVSGRDELCHEILLSANNLVHAEKTEAEEGDALQDDTDLVCKSTQKTSKQESILPEVQHTGGIIASNTVSPESTDTGHLPVSLHIDNMKSKKKRKRHDMTLSGADNHERASCPSSVKDSSVKDRVMEKNIPLSHVTGEPERMTSEQETTFPEDQCNSQIIASNIMPSEFTDTDQMAMSLSIENMKSKKKRKMHEMNFSSAENHEKPGLPSSVKDSSIEDKVKEKNTPSNQVTGEVLSANEILEPSNLLLDTESKVNKEIEDSPKETNVPDSTSKEVFELPRNSEGQNDSPEVVLDPLSSEPADNQHLGTSPAIKSKRGKKKRKKDVKQKKDVTFSSPSAVVLPSSVPDAEGEESVQEKIIASNDASAGDESHQEVTVPINLVVNAEKTEREGNSGDPLKENKGLVSINGTSTLETGLTDNSMADKHNNQKLVMDLSSAAADNEHLRTGTGNKSKKDKKKRKSDASINISNSAVLPSFARDAGAESLKDKKRASNYASAEDEVRPESAVLENLLVDRERTGHANVGKSSKEEKNLVSSKKTSTRGTGLNRNTVEDQSIVVFRTSSPEPAESEHLRMDSSIKRKKSKKKSKKDTAFSLSSAGVLPASAQDVGEESCKEKKITLNNVSGEDESLQKIVVPANLLVNTERTEQRESSGDHFEQNKGLVSKCKNTSTQESGFKENSVQDQDNSQKVAIDTLYPELADSEQLGTNSNIKKTKKKKKRKMDATLTSPIANVLPSFVEDAAGEESLKEKIVPSHEDELHGEIVVPENLLLNAGRPEHEEISGHPLEEDKVGLSAASTTIGLNLDSNTAQIPMKEDLVNVQSADMIEDKSRKDQATFNTQSQPAASESGSDRIDFKHYFLPGKAEGPGSARDGITRSERDDITKKSPNKKTASLITSHDQAPSPQSSKNQEGGVKSHIKCSSDIDPQESFSQDVSSRSLRPSKKSTSNKYQKGLPSSFQPDQARAPHPVLRASGRGVSVNSTPAPAYRNGKKVSSAASSSESFGKSRPGTKSKKLVSNADRRLVACAKGSAKGISEVKSRPLHKKSLLKTPGFIFKDDSSESSDDEGASERFHARTPSEDVSSSDSDRESQLSLDSLKKASGSSGLDKKEDVVNIEKKRSSNLRTTTIDMILRSSSRYKKAKLTAESQPEVEDSESQPVDCVPDSQAIP